VRDDVVGEDEAAVRRALGGDDRARVQGRVVVDHDRRRAVDDLEEPAVPAPARSADVDEQVVADLDALRRAPELPPSSAAVTMAAMRSRGARRRRSAVNTTGKPVPPPMATTLTRPLLCAATDASSRPDCWLSRSTAPASWDAR
jgi:hypothetical protein